MVALVSGLDLDGSKSFGIQYQMLFDFLSGELGTPQNQTMSSNIVKVIFAGNHLSKTVMTVDERRVSSKLKFF